MKKRANENVETIAYKFRIYPNEEQKVIFAKTFGCVRYLWNRMLADHNELYRIIGHVPDNTPADYKGLDECLWLSEVDSMALDSVRIDQKQAFEMFYKNKSGHPVFHRKHKKQSYRTNCINNNIKLFPDSIKLPKIAEPVKMNRHRKIRQGGKLKSVAVSKETNGQYYASILFEYPRHTFTDGPVYREHPTATGLDMKLRALYVDDKGASADMPDFYRAQEVNDFNSIDSDLLIEVAKRYAKYAKDECIFDVDTGETQSFQHIINKIVECCEEHDWFKN